MHGLRISLLGPPHIECGGTLVRFASRKSLALLAYMAITRRIHRRDTLATMFWPDSDQSAARQSLRGSIYEINKKCGSIIETPDRETIDLTDESTIWIDGARFVDRFEECGTHGHASDAICTNCLDPLREALSLYRGKFLEGFTLKDSLDFDNWQLTQTEYFRNEMASGFDRLVRYYRESGDMQNGIECSLRWQELESFNEESYRFLMELYARSGQREAALHQYHACVRMLREDMAVSPDEATVKLYHEIEEDRLSADVASDNRVIIQKHNLPLHFDGFIGRDAYLREAKELLASTRLLSLTGTGGSGKTRLAVEIADGMVGDFPDGICFVDLAPLQNPYLIPQTVASALGVRIHSNLPAIEILTNFLFSKQMLIVMDNCEHLSPNCGAVIGELLRICLRIKCLATSREPLHLQGEKELLVEPLDVPPAGDLSAEGASAESIDRYDAVRLYVERASSVIPRFRITGNNASTIAEICIFLDGLPLAIELAAARAKILPPEELVKHMDRRLDFIKGVSPDLPARQLTLRDTISWSFDLLDEHAKRLFKRLAVFAGGCTCGGAIAICEECFSETEVVDGLSSLIDKSLLRSQYTAGEQRFYMFDTIREFAYEKLLKDDEAGEVKGRHAEFYLQTAVKAETGLHGADQQRWCDRLEGEIENLRAALAFFRSQQSGDKGLQMAAAIGFFWARRGYFKEGSDWITAFLPKEGEPSEAEVIASFWYSWFCFFLGDRKLALEITRKCIEKSESLGIRSYLALSLTWAGFLERYRGQIAAGWDHCRRALVIAFEHESSWITVETLYCAFTRPKPNRMEDTDFGLIEMKFEETIDELHKAGDLWGVALGKHALGDMLAVHRGVVKEAIANYRDSLRFFQELDDKWMTADTLSCLGISELKGHNIEEAERCFRESLSIFYEIGSYVFIPVNLELLARVAIIKKDFGRAACLIGAAGTSRKSISSDDDQFEQKRFRGVDLNNPLIAACSSEGKKMSIRQAIEYATKTCEA